MSFAYTNGGLVDVITDRKGFTYRYEYDAAGRKAKFWYPAANGVGYASWESWTYTPTGQVSEFVNRSGQRLVYTYDNRNRETQRAWDGGVAPTVSTTYDAASRVLTRSNPTGTLTYGYDAAGRLTSESQAIAGGQTVVVGIVYDVDGRRQTRTATGEQDLGYVYDARGQLTSMGSTGMTFGFSYDLAGARTQRTSPNGTATGYLYDGAGRLVTVDSYVVSGFTNILRQDFGRDLRDRRTWSLRDAGYGDSYTYQANGELTGFRFDQWRPDQNPGGTAASADTYAYDPNGNRTTRNENGNVTTYTANALNEYTAVSGSSIAHSDGRGNITQWQAWSYTYDAENRLVLAVGSGLTVGFRYDAQGRLAKLERNGVAEFRYFDGTHRFLRKDAGGGVQERTIWGPSANEALARWTPGDGWHYFHHDPLNSPVAITNTSGLVIERYLYDVFGMDFMFDATGTPRATSIVANPWRFTGQEWMADLALHNYKNRFYHNDLGRFIQQDPLRFDAGDFNLYRYCGNDGINHVDPHGLAMSRNPYAIKFSLITTFGSKAEERENSSQQLGADTVEEQAENGPRSPKNAPNRGGGMARDPGEVMANQVMMNQLAPYLAVGDVVSRWNPGLPKITGSYDGVVGGNIGASMKLGPVIEAGAGVKIGMYTNTNDQGRTELLFGGKVTGSGGAFGFTAEGKLGYEYGVGSRLYPVDRPIRDGSVDYRGFDLKEWTWETKIKTPFGDVKIIVDPTPLLRIDPPPGSGTPPGKG